MSSQRTKVNYNIARKTVTDAEMLIAAPTTLFTVTGLVEMIIFGRIKEAVTSGGACTLEVGIAGGTATLIAQAAKAALLANLIWKDATPVNPAALPASKLVENGADVIQTTGTTDANGGEIEYYCLWRPLAPGSKVVAA